MLTPSKDLRTGRSVWLSYPSPRIPLQALTADRKADVIVIGAGITGAMAAQELSEAGFSVIVLERRAPLVGATTASTALLQAEIDEPLIRLARKIGRTDAERAWRRSKLALESLSSKIRMLRIRCRMTRHPSLYLTGSLLDADEMQQECEARNAIGLQNEFLGRSALRESYGLKRNGASKVLDSIAVNPRQMAAGFLRHAIANGANVFAPANAEDIESDAGGVNVRTAQGPIVRAKCAIFATGYEIPKYLQGGKYRVRSSWAIATKRQPTALWPGSCFIWEAADPYLYLRTTWDGRVVCGGEDESFSDEEKRDALIPRKTVALERKLRALLPGLDSRAHFAWSGCFGSSATALPGIGAVPGLKNCFAVLAFGGNGITFSRIAAEALRSELTGRDDPEADLFAFAK